MLANDSKKDKLRRVVYLIMILLFLIYCAVTSAGLLPGWDSVYTHLGLRPKPIVPAADELLVTLLDVGNADAILLQTDGHAMLIDAGTAADAPTLISGLQQAGITSLDYILATHSDADHIGGMSAVLRTVSVNCYITTHPLTSWTSQDTTANHTAMWLLRKGVPLQYASAGDRFTLGDAAVEILGSANNSRNHNDDSVICRVTFGEKAFLFMGDAEQAAEEALLQNGALLSADVIKIGHHGSSSGSTLPLLKAVDPAIALISCGVDNRYGHPAETVIKRLQLLDIAVWRTDVNGTLRIFCNGSAIRVEPERGSAA